MRPLLPLAEQSQQIVRLEKRLRRHGVSVKALHIAVPVDPGLWSRYRNHARRPRPEHWERIVATAERLIAERKSA